MTASCSLVRSREVSSSFIFELSIQGPAVWKTQVEHPDVSLSTCIPTSPVSSSVQHNSGARGWRGYLVVIEDISWVSFAFDNKSYTFQVSMIKTASKKLCLCLIILVGRSVATELSWLGKVRFFVAYQRLCMLTSKCQRVGEHAGTECQLRTPLSCNKIQRGLHWNSFIFVQW
jgi:hypothetical protein